MLHYILRFLTETMESIFIYTSMLIVWWVSIIISICENIWENVIKFLNISERWRLNMCSVNIIRHKRPFEKFVYSSLLTLPLLFPCLIRIRSAILFYLAYCLPCVYIHTCAIYIDILLFFFSFFYSSQTIYQSNYLSAYLSTHLVVCLQPCLSLPPFTLPVAP